MSEVGSKSPGAEEFVEFKKELEATKGIKFYARVEDVPPIEDGVKRLVIISASEYYSLASLLVLFICFSPSYLFIVPTTNSHDNNFILFM